LFDEWEIEITKPTTAEIVQEVHYDPWGLVMQDESYFAPASPAEGSSLFNGKELQTLADLHLYDYHWRQYDPQLGRWHNIDPSADKYHGFSPYNYCFNNPVMIIDPDGREPFSLATVAVAALYAGLFSAGASAVTYTAMNFNNWNLADFGKSVGLGFVSGAVSGGLGSAFGQAGVAILGGTTGIGRGLAGLGLQLASTGLKSIAGNLATGQAWDSSFDIGVGSFTLPFRNGRFSLNPLDHLSNIITIRTHFRVLFDAMKGNSRIGFDVNSMRMVASTKLGVTKGYVYRSLLTSGGHTKAGTFNNGVLFMQYESYYDKNCEMTPDFAIKYNNTGNDIDNVVSKQAYGNYYSPYKSFLFHEGILIVSGKSLIR
jgi:RHS repeat-associated protein